MTDTSLDVETAQDGSLVIQPHGVLDADDAVELRRTLVHAIRRVRPLRLILDLHDVDVLDAINVGTVVAACHLGDDHHVAIFVDHSSIDIAALLMTAGIPRHRLRHVAEKPLS